MTVRFIDNPSRLGAKLAAPGGKAIGEAVAQAEAAVAAAAPEGLLALDAAVSAIANALGGAAAASIPTEALEVIYREAAQIHGVAGVFGLGDMGEAAWSLCELIDSGAATSRTGPAALASHLDSLRLLRQGDTVPAVQRRALLEGLQDLRLHNRPDTPAV